MSASTAPSAVARCAMAAKPVRAGRGCSGRDEIVSTAPHLHHTRSECDVAVGGAVDVNHSSIRPPASKYVLLIVDDEVLGRAPLVDVFEALGYTVLEAATAAEAPTSAVHRVGKSCCSKGNTR